MSDKQSEEVLEMLQVIVGLQLCTLRGQSATPEIMTTLDGCGVGYDKIGAMFGVKPDAARMVIARARGKGASRRSGKAKR